MIHDFIYDFIQIFQSSIFSNMHVLLCTNEMHICVVSLAMHAMEIQEKAMQIFFFFSFDCTWVQRICYAKYFKWITEMLNLIFLQSTYKCHHRLFRIVCNDTFSNFLHCSMFKLLSTLPQSIWLNIKLLNRVLSIQRIRYFDELILFVCLLSIYCMKNVNFITHFNNHWW